MTTFLKAVQFVLVFKCEKGEKGNVSGPLPRFIQAKNHRTIALIQSTMNVCKYKQLMR